MMYQRARPSVSPRKAGQADAGGATPNPESFYKYYYVVKQETTWCLNVHLAALRQGIRGERNFRASQAGRPSLGETRTANWESGIQGAWLEQVGWIATRVCSCGVDSALIEEHSPRCRDSGFLVLSDSQYEDWPSGYLSVTCILQTLGSTTWVLELTNTPVHAAWPWGLRKKSPHSMAGVSLLPCAAWEKCRANLDNLAGSTKMHLDSTRVRKSRRDSSEHLVKRRTCELDGHHIVATRLLSCEAALVTRRTGRAARTPAS